MFSGYGHAVMSALTGRKIDQKSDFAVLPRKTLGTFPRHSVLVEGGELDLARSVVAIIEDSGFDAANPNLMDGLVVFGLEYGRRGARS